MMVVWTVVWGFLDSFLRYRFLKKMLGVKYYNAYLWFFLGTFLYGQMNVRYTLAGTVWGNLAYLCVCSFGLNLMLFHGSVIKKGFFTLWMYCAPGIAFDVFFPLVRAAAIMNGESDCSYLAVKIVEMVSGLIFYLMMEVLQRELHILKRDFEDKDAVYLMCTLLYIYAANSTIQEMFIGIQDWWPENVWRAAVPCSLIALGGTMLYIYCIVMLEKRLLERLAKQQYEMLDRQMGDYTEQYRQLIKIQHDIKNHALCISQLLAEGKTEEAVYYLKELNIRMSQKENVVRTGSVFADALLNPKYHQAQASGIDISIKIIVPGEDVITPTDLCCLLANTLDNAMEACQRAVKEGNPAGWICMRSCMKQNYWVLEVRNSIQEIPVRKNGSFLSLKRLHSYGRKEIFHDIGEDLHGMRTLPYKAGRQYCGLEAQYYGVGLQNIKTVVEQYEGVMDIQCETDFSISIMLPM